MELPSVKAMWCLGMAVIMFGGVAGGAAVGSKGVFACVSARKDSLMHMVSHSRSMRIRGRRAPLRSRSALHNAVVASSKRSASKRETRRRGRDQVRIVFASCHLKQKLGKD